MRFAFKIAYDGTRYHGYACQPNVNTIEGAIIDTLTKIGAIKYLKKAQLCVASRTDKGVSAWGNVIAFTTSMEKASLINALSNLLEDIWIIAYASVPKNFHPRHAEQRHYRYYLINDNLDIKKMREVAQLFTGVHDFSNFAKIENKNPVRRIDKIKIQAGHIIKIDFIAKTFLWNQVRRMVSVIEKAGKGESTDELKAALTCKKKINFGIAPPENLVLIEVSYRKNLNFRFISYAENILKMREESMEKCLIMLRDMRKCLFENVHRRNK